MNKKKIKERVKSTNFGFTKIAIIFVLINLIVKLYLALRPLEYIDGLLIPDDAYLSLTIARNVASGLGPLYGNEFTNGFQPLYVFLMVPVYILFPNDLFTPIHIALIILTIFDALTLYYLFKFVKLFIDNFWSFIFLGAAWIFNINILKNSINGLETSISLFFIVLTLYYFYKYQKAGKQDFKSYFIVGLLCGLGIFARIDNIFLLFSISIIILINNNNAISEKLKFIAFILVGSLIAYLPWLIYSYAHTGDITPISGKAVRYMSLAQVNHNPTWDNWYSKILEVAIKVIYNNNTVLIFILIILIIVIAFSYKKDYINVINLGSPILLLFMLSVFLLGSYSFYIFTFWFFERYFYPIVLFFLIANTLMISYLNQSPLNKNLIKLINIGIIIIIVAGNISQENFGKVFFSKDSKNLGYMNAGLWCSSNFKSGMTIGSSQTGAIGYFAKNLKVINLDGVVSKSCYESLKNKTYIEYIKEQKIQAIIGWQQNINFIKTESTNFKDTDLSFLGTIPDFKTRNYEWLIYKVNY